MTGKAYSMKEMKAIVNYLVEHKAFSEIRGRKMWMDFASSKETTRTWQSLKETFLKRILPDIQNPYYKLTPVEIASFKQGMDIVSKLDNKLDFEFFENENAPGTSKEIGKKENQEEVGDKVQEEVGDKVQEKNNVNNEVPGEDVNISEILNDIRASTETIVLETCYNTAEDIQKELENDNNNDKNIPKSKKDDQDHSNMPQDLMLVINDFTSDIENVDEINNHVKNKAEQSNQEADSPIKISDSEKKIVVVDIVTAETNMKTEQKKNNTEDNPKNTSSSILSTKENDISNNLEENKEKPENGKKLTPNTLNSTIDTQLPNNPKGLQKPVERESSKNINKLSLKSHKRNKRAASEDTTSKRKKNKQQSVSDTGARKNLKNYDFMKEVINEEKQQKEATAANKNCDIDSHSKDQQENIGNNEKEAKNISPDAQVIGNDGPLDIDTNTKQNETTNAVLVEKIQKTQENENPCLKSVNLYEEQFSCTIYSETDNEQKEKNNKPQKKQDIPQQKPKQCVELSSSTTDASKTNKTSLKMVEKKRRDKALSRTFGFTTSVPRKRSHSYNKRSSGPHHKIVINSSNSSNSSYNSDSTYVSSPRGNNNKRMRKFLKPVSHRIMMVGEEGALFVMNGKKIYPVVRNDKPLMTYLTYSSDEDTEPDWKLKYVEEKRKAAELAKQLEDLTKSKAAESSVAPASTTIDLEVPKTNDKGEVCPKTTVPESKAVDEKIQIKIVKNDEVVHVDGPLTYMNRLLQQLLLSRENNKDNCPTTAHTRVEQRATSSDVVALSGMSSPADSSSKRVEEIEKEIFKEIAELDSAERENNENAANVTTRKTTRKRSLSIDKVPVSPKKANADEENKEKSKEPVRRSTRTPRKQANEKLNTPAKTNVKKGSSKKAESENEDTKVLYKFPSTSKETYRGKRAPPRNSYTIKTARVYSSPDHLSLHSEETQGYIDSDRSPVICMRRKKYYTSRKASNYFRKKSIPSITEDISSESNVSTLTAPLKTQTFTNSSVSSHIYRSDSYQLLMPKTKNTPKHLEKIEECLMNSNKSNLSATDEVESNCDKYPFCESSLPTSPVLSIVENISINQSVLSSFDDENGIDEPTNKITLNSIMPEVVDASMPLMDSNYTLKKKNMDGITFHYNLYDRNVTDSTINKASSVQIDDMSNSISQKLEKLIIESAKKNATKTYLSNDLEELPTAEKPTKSKAKKISSTPRKRQCLRKSKSFRTELCVEEHTESCSKAVDNSQIPVIIISPPDPEIPPQDVQTPTKVTTRRERVKKDIIKVKLPKIIRRRKSDTASKTFMDSSHSANNGTNDAESGIFLQGNEESVDLIHNHSDTCCKAHECINDSSVEIIETSPPSFITLDLESVHKENNEYECSNACMSQSVALEMMGQDAQDGTDLNADFASISPGSGIANSLLTDDLSVDTPKSSSWYLFDEDNSTMVFQGITESQSLSVGANLNAIFPITCAVPNLSTITEASKDNDENSKNVD